MMMFLEKNNIAPTYYNVDLTGLWQINQWAETSIPRYRYETLCALLKREINHERINI